MPAPGAFRIVARRDRFLPGQLRLEPLIESHELPPLTMVPATATRLTLVGEDRRPIPGAFALARILQQRSRTEIWTPALQRARQGESGVELLLTEPTEVVVWAPGRAERTVALEPGARASAQLPAVEEIEVLVTDPSGPVPGALGLVGAGDWAAAIADHRGVIELPRSADRAWAVAGGDRFSRIALEGDPPYHATLPSVRALTGEVHEHATGTPIAGALVVSTRRPALYALTDGRGRFQLDL